MSNADFTPAFYGNPFVGAIPADTADNLLLSTGQKLQSPEEIEKFLGEVKGDIAQEVEAMTEEGLERPLECFFKGIGRCWS